MNRVILPISIVPPIAFLVAAAQAREVVVDGGENYVKQTIRNRYHILSANGVHSLTANVNSQQGKKIPTGKITIDYSKNWSREHLRAIESAYRSAPFFEHYFPAITEMLNTTYTNLEDMFLTCFPRWLTLCNIELNWNYHRAYVEIPAEQDFRKRIKQTVDFPNSFATLPYIQVFSDRFPFIAHLSILDLLMNEGPATNTYLSKERE